MIPNFFLDVTVLIGFINQGGFMFNKKTNILKLVLIFNTILLNGCIMQREVNSFFDIGLVTDSSHYAIAIFEKNKKNRDTVKFDVAINDGYMLMNVQDKFHNSVYKEINKLLIFNDNMCLDLFNEYIDILYNKYIPIDIINECIINCHPNIYTREEIHRMTNKVHIPGYFTCCFVQYDGSLICKSTDNDVRHKLTRVIL